jgi:hypothetical protein
MFSVAQSIELVPISGHQHQKKIRYINQAQHKPSARVKTNINNIKKLMSMHNFTAIVVKIRVLSEQKSSLSIKAGSKIATSAL